MGWISWTRRSRLVGGWSSWSGRARRVGWWVSRRVGWARRVGWRVNWWIGRIRATNEGWVSVSFCFPDVSEVPLV